MKLSIDGRLRLAAHAAFVTGLAAASFQVIAQEAPQPVPPTTSTAEPAPAPLAPAVAVPAEASIPVAALPPEPAVAAKSEGAVKLERVQVTGSRIKQPNLTSASPITTVSAAEVKYQGTTRVEDLLNNLPQVFADQGGNISNGSTGTANVDLRDLGAARTLVLIDGKRVQPGDPRTNAPSVDLNFIPSALIERVDVLTGGASATYGADAVAGVVNFIMKKDFQGVRLEAQRSIYNHENSDENVAAALSRSIASGRKGYAFPNDTKWDGQGWDLTALFGGNFGDGKGNATVYATYRQLDPITQAARDFSACTVQIPGGAAGLTSSRFNCGGSATAATGLITEDLALAEGPFYTVQGDQFRDFDFAADVFNFGPYNYYQRNDERYMLGAFAHYEINKHFDAYTQLMFMNDQTNAVIAPSGSFLSQYTVFFENPLFSAQQRNMLFGPDTNNDPNVDSRTGSSTDVLIGRRNVEGGGRDDNLGHSAFRLLGGVRGEAFADWSYDVFAQYGTTNFQQIYRNDFSNARLQRAIDVVDGDPGAGVSPVCRSAADGSDPNCVPYNIWRTDGVTPAALQYLQTPGFSSGVVTERVVGASLSGNLPFTIPFAKDPIGLAGGVEYRSEELRAEADTAFVTGDLAGQGGAFTPTKGAFDVREVFGEARLPIWQDLPFGKDLSVGLGYRYSDYSSFDSTDTYKFDVTYAPVEDIKARFSYNRAVRAPSINELSSPLSVGLDGNTDPCSGATPEATAAQCANDPVIRNNPALYGNIAPNPASQYNGLLGSSPGLSAEEADTYTYGLVFTPTFIKNASLSVDYYRIKVDGLIGGYGADVILEQCYTNGALCNLINRDPATGSLWLNPNGFVIDTTQNTGSLLARGIDIKADYRLRSSDLGFGDFGSVAFDLIGSYLIEQKIQPVPGAPSSAYNCEGLYGPKCGAPISQWRHKFRTTWNMPWYNASLSAAWRYLGGVKWDGVGRANNLDRELDAESYLDLFTSVKFMSRYTVRAGVNNVLDNDPPIVGQGALTSVSGNGNTYPQVYDALGRYIFAGVTLDF